MNVCTCCGKRADQPYRSYDQQGNIVHGCVDKFHDGALTPMSNTCYWHNRKEAKQIRAMIAKHRKEILGC